MGNIRNGYSNYIKYYLKADVNASSLKMDKEPIGWDDDDLVLKRHKQYHGVFFTFTNSLRFKGEAKNYIQNAYDLGGINTNLFLTKEVLKKVDGDIKFVRRYTALADFNTKKEKDGILEINFNDNDLEEIIKSHETDTFEIERTDSIDGDDIGFLETNKTEIKGRRINIVGESIFKTSRHSDTKIGTHWLTPLTKLVTDNQTRHSEVEEYQFDEEDVFGIGAENMFYDNTEIYTNDSLVNVRYNLNFSIENARRFITVHLKRFDFDNQTGIYNEVESIELLNDIFPTSYKTGSYSIKGSYIKTLKNTEALMLEFRIGGNYDNFSFDENVKSNIIVEEEVFYDSSPSLEFIFTYDLVDRLMQILTGRKDAFYSKLLGRTDILNTNGSPKYAEDGEWGLIGNMSGLWIRAFEKATEKYKSLKTSLKDVIDSLKSVANVGISIETFDLKQRLRIEDLKFFYRPEVAVKLPSQVTNVEREVDSSLFFSGLEFGYEHSGDYSNDMGLDEPNTRTDFVTPIRKSKNKFSKISKIRSDEYEMERLRRMPQLTFPNEETRSDDSIWFVDLKRSKGLNYVQTEPEDRLEQLEDGTYAQGIYSPETYRSMFFTPLRMLFRHDWVFRAGMEKYLDKYIRYISSDSNSNLRMKFKGEQAYTESTNLQVGALGRSKFLPEKVKCNHQIDDDLMDLITGTTKVEYPKGSGVFEEIPNFYFKFEWINEKGQIERGYLLELKPNDKGEFLFQSANENTI